MRVAACKLACGEMVGFSVVARVRFRRRRSLSFNVQAPLIMPRCMLDMDGLRIYYAGDFNNLNLNSLCKPV